MLIYHNYSGLLLQTLKRFIRLALGREDVFYPESVVDYHEEYSSRQLRRK